MWTEVVVTSTHEAVDAVTDALYSVGAGGVVIEDDQLVQDYIDNAGWDAYDVGPLTTEDKVRIKAYLPGDDRLKERLRSLRARLSGLRRHIGTDSIGCLSASEIDEESWASAWKAYYKPIPISPRLTVVPEWEEYQPIENEQLIRLDPGMAFGTGSHATTFLCLRALDQYVQPGMQICDVGTGSGILSIAAVRLGADQVSAIDLDELAVRIAKENIALNGVQSQISVQVGDLLNTVTHTQDLLVANIVADAIISLAPDVPRVLREDGVFISSGIIDLRAEEVRQSIEKAGFQIEDVREQEGWVAIIARRRSGS